MDAKILFLSDAHLGTPNYEDSLLREKKICNLLDEYKDSIEELFLVGDIFDFWFEYSTVSPKGYYRILGKLAELSDRGIKIHYFIGNHDMWIFDFFEKELQATIYRQPQVFERYGKRFYIGHGDGLGPGDHKYKFLKLFFSSKICQFLFKWIHPDIGMGIANYFSYRSRFATQMPEERYLGNEKEWLYHFSKEYLSIDNNIDYFMFGHRHLPIYTNIEATSVKYVNLGDWLFFNTFSVFDGKEVHLLQYDSKKMDNDFNPNK